jgi:hypothetical protein
MVCRNGEGCSATCGLFIKSLIGDYTLNRHNLRFLNPHPSLPRWERGQKEAQVVAMHSLLIESEQQAKKDDEIVNLCLHYKR